MAEIKKNIKKHPENKINGSKKKPTDGDAGKKKNEKKTALKMRKVDE